MCGIIASYSCPPPRRERNAHGQTTGHETDTKDKTSESSGVASGGSTRDAIAKALQAGIDSIKHRGPDGSGIWVSTDAGVGLAHCRLSVIDLSPGGAQPLHSDDGLIHAVVIGEIYDNDRLRKVCATKYAYRFAGQSDSELVISLYKIHGAPGLFEHLRGEFSFALFDEREGSRRLVAARDRFGIKPLLWTALGDKILFAAEAKAFLAFGWKPEWNVRALADSGWMMNDSTVFKGVTKLMPGHWAEITQERGMEIHKYWDADYPDKTVPDPRTVDEMILQVRQRLVEAIRARLRADVPVGIYLSGGIDSSVIAGIVAELVRKDKVQIGSGLGSRIACFTIQFPSESGYDESDIADRTAEWLGVEMFKQNVNEQRLAKDFANAAYHCEHHHFDLNSVAKFALSALAREHGFKVVLTGEGSDEHFAGYPFFPPEFLREPDGGMPGSILAEDSALRQGMQKSASAEIAALLRSQGAAVYEDMADAGVLADANKNTMPNSLLAWHPANSLFLDWVQVQYQGKRDMRDTVMAAHSSEVREKMRQKWHAGHTAMYMWNKSLLINIILSCLGDRVEMAHGVEARTPFLDHRLAEYVNSLPPSVKMRYSPPDDKGQKWILREVARPYITDELYTRRKLPILAPARWPRDGPLHSMFKKLLSAEAVDSLGFVNYGVVEKALDKAFGDEADPKSFRILCYTGSWVTLGKIFGIKKATVEESRWA
ncbi:asparagine synthase domain-containing protein [Hirsutella rhossiliensis]|uniref:Asparagine synthase domain-containing protein n=1 Tax=Hirsutella rhossiliensis TaxID=111463 RepID=A0A9P8SLU6_9HYPO|nr:asparagine synthase domain-containing protein [Hirsutella rhossiliensis]KAH0965511.1 asparagine synthase domain-containing protein [Hirsutella rhossiliensis]